MKLNQIIKILSFFLVFFLLNACGFQFRGQLPQLDNLSNPVFIDGIEKYSKLYREMERQLQITGIKPINTKEGSSTQILITDIKSVSRVFKLNADSSAKEFELEESFTFSVTSRNKKVVTAQKIKILRIFTTSSANSSIRQREEMKIREDMREDLIKRMIRRIKAQG
tara:strand:+ start:176 stop:676 length:501 start_codon:yes stop_codon:yes gene_type:complete